MFKYGFLMFTFNEDCDTDLASFTFNTSKILHKSFEGTKILIAINICMASLSRWSAPVKSSRKVSERHR